MIVKKDKEKRTDDGKKVIRSKEKGVIENE
jgi:hypothetical protein